ncbi:MAG: porin [Planctomycetaceae bacterium]|nr:porin [Planctomycetaceae bacterium]
MKRNLLAGLGVVAALFAMQFTQADAQGGLFDRFTPCAQVGECNPCDDDSSCDPCGDVDSCSKKSSKWFATGYIEAGFFANEYGQKNFYNPRTPGYSHNNVLYGNGGYSNATDGRYAPLQNVAHTGGQLNQLYLSVGRAVDGKRGLDIGGTTDFTFGTDAYLVQSNGLEYGAGHGLANDSWGTGDYYSAIAQAYLEIAYKKWNVKIGKVYTPFGSNSYKSTDRFFYSLADTYAMVPATALAAYATYTVNDKLSVYGGWAQPDQFGETSDDNAFLFGFDLQVSKRLALSYALGVGTNETDPTNDIDYFVQSLVAKYQVNRRLTQVFDWSLYNINPEVGDRQGVYGINTESIYQYNSRWAFGFRAGWGRNINDFLYPSAGGGQGYDNKYTFSLGANWTPRKWLTVKTELRYDKFEDTAAFYTHNDDGTARAAGKTDQFSGGVSAIVKF